jgi:lisH domain-containing protein FOPNL
MASLDDLKNVLKETLEQRGVLGEIKSKIRSEIFTALDNDTMGKPPLSQENMLINEMIREYLEFNQYYNTLSVLTSESGQPKEPFLDRTTMHKKLSLKPSKDGLPILYEMIGMKPEAPERQEMPISDDEDEDFMPKGMSFKN